ncbi:MAG: TIGR03067 domain-containing protein [Gemmatales bacterium]
MKSMFTSAALLLLCLASVADDKKADSYDGTWVPTKVMMGGQALPDEMMKEVKLTVKGNSYEVAFGGQVQKGSLTFDNKTTPKRLKIESKEGPDAGKTLSCIHESKGDEWTICYQEGNEYPKEFKSPEGTTTLLITYKKAK